MAHDGTDGESDGLSILLVEDDALLRESMRDVLELLGHRVDVAVDGEDGLRAARRHIYDVVLMDLELPGINGLEASRVLAASRQNPQRPRIIVLSGHSVAENRLACLAAGADTFVAKPVRISELNRLLLACASRSNSPLGIA